MRTDSLTSGLVRINKKLRIENHWRAEMADGAKYVTLTQFIEVDKETLLDLRTHILPLSGLENYRNQATSSDQKLINQGYGYWSEQKKQPCAWFTDQTNQELLVCVHEVIYTKAVENLLHHRTQSKSNSAANNKPAYEFRQSDSFRMLLTFRPLKHRQHILFPSQSISGQVLVPRAAVVTEYGRRVLPYLNTPTFVGSGYRAYRVLPEALHVFVDKLELTSPHGIFKMLRLLDPKHPLSPDILSYFKQPMASSTEESEQAEVLPQVPVAGLRQKVHGSNKRSTKSSIHLTRSKGSNMKQQAKSKLPQQQPTIIKVFAKYQQVVENKEDGADEVLPDDILDDVWDFDLSQPNPVVSEENKSDNDHSLSDEEVITEEPSQPTLEDKDKRTVTHVSPKVHGSKRQKSSAACCSSPTAANSKKAKLSQTSSATKPQNDITEQALPDFNDPFDELAACQARKTKDEGSSAGAHFFKRQWVRIGDEDEYVADIDDTLKPTSTATTITHTYSSDEEEEFETALDPFNASSKQQQERGCVKATLTSKLPSTASPSTIPIASQNALSISTKDVEEMLFGISTPDVELSPAEFPEIEKDLASCSLHIHVEEHSVPRLARRSASQPIVHCLSEDQEDTRSSLRTKAKSYSDSVLETELQAKFDDITNTVTNPQKDVAISPQKKSDNVPARRSIVDLSQTPVNEQVQSKMVDKKKRKRPLPTSGVEIFRGAKRVADLSRQQLIDWMRLNQPVMMNIFKREEYSWRHEEFNTNPKMRAAMKWRYDSRRFTDDQVKLITDILLKIFCWRHMKYFNYVMSVLLPESLVRVIADVHQVNFEEAEKLMFSFQGRARVDLTSD